MVIVFVRGRRGRLWRSMFRIVCSVELGHLCTSVCTCVRAYVCVCVARACMHTMCDVCVCA